MTAGLVYDHDALPETCHAEGHVPGCPGRAGGDHEWIGNRQPFHVSYERCSECGDLLDGFGACSTHGHME